MKKTGLWRVPLENNNQQLGRDIEHRISSSHHMKNQTDLVKYLHVAVFRPVHSTWTREIQKWYFQTWTGLTVQLVTKYLPNSVATEKGHMDQARENIR